MYCPQCGTESSEGLQYCRTCGANLKVIGRAGSGLDNVDKALDKMNAEIMENSGAPWAQKPWRRPQKSAAERREKHIVRGTGGIFGGVGLMIFLFYFCGALVLKVPPDVLAKIPFELEPAVRMFWLVGLIPTLSGLGQIIAGLSIRATPAKPMSAPIRMPDELAAHSSHTRHQLHRISR